MNTANVDPSNLDLIEADFNTTLTAGSVKGAMKNAGASSRDIWQLDPAKIKVFEGLNPRVMNEKYKAHIRSLADSIVSEGYYQSQPMAGYVEKVSGEVYLYDGHSRLLAVKLAISEGAQIPRVPVTVSMEGLSVDDITVSLIRANSGKNLSYYESAIVCKRLIKSGFTTEEISTRTGINPQSVKARLDLMASPFKLREMVANEIISATLAIEMIAKHGGKALEQIEKAQESANEAGKTRVTKNQTQKSEIFERAKFVKKSAPRLYEAANAVLDDPGYKSLTDETRELIESLLAEIKTSTKTPGEDTATGQLPLAIEADGDGY